MFKLFLLVLILSVSIVACTDKEEFEGEIDNVVLLESESDNSETVEIAHVRSERKPMTTRSYKNTKADLGNISDSDLLDLIAGCIEREAAVNFFKLDYDDLTLAVEIADLKRTGMSTDLAVDFHIALSDLSDKSGGLDVVKLASLSASVLSDLDISINETAGWISVAKSLKQRITYPVDGVCVLGSMENNGGKKTILTKTYSSIIKELPVSNDNELLSLIANCGDRQNIGIQYGIDIDELTLAVELADLKRIGISNDEAATLLVAAGELDQANFVGTIDVIAGRSLDIGLLGQLPVLELQGTLQSIDCYDCILPANGDISNWIQEASELSPVVSYLENGNCQMSI